VACLWVIAPTSKADFDNTPDAIAERIQKVGNVCLEGNPCAAAQSATGDTAALTGPAPQTTYDTYCAVCHNAGIAGAPINGDTNSWSTRLEKGINTVYSNAINGIGGMPAKGMCMNCTDDDIKATVDLMFAESNITIN